MFSSLEISVQCHQKWSNFSHLLLQRSTSRFYMVLTCPKSPGYPYIHLPHTYFNNKIMHLCDSLNASSFICGYEKYNLGCESIMAVNLDFQSRGTKFQVLLIFQHILWIGLKIPTLFLASSRTTQHQQHPKLAMIACLSCFNHKRRKIITSTNQWQGNQNLQRASSQRNMRGLLLFLQKGQQIFQTKDVQQISPCKH